MLTRPIFSASAQIGEGTTVMAGAVVNPDAIVGQGAIFDVPVGRGRVVAFTFDPEESV